MRIYWDRHAGGPDELTRLGDEWRKTHAAVLDKFRSHYQWAWVRLEDLSRAPLKEVMGLYDKFGFEWSAEVKREVEAMTSTASDDFYGTNRNSKTQIDKWRDALASEQIEAIQRGCPPHGTGLYEGF